MTMYSLFIGFLAFCHHGSFLTAAQNTFIVVGDWGTYPGRGNQMRVAEQMGIWAEENGCDFIVSTGDNFYPDGIEDGNQSERFDYNWREVYDHPATADLDWYITVGNHDHGLDYREMYQVEFSDYEERWKLPWLWHSFQMPEDDGRAISFIGIDTQALFDERYDKEEQMEWLEEQLADAMGQWIFVIGHHPPLSAGHTWGEEVVFEDVLPLLEGYGADFFITGHDHTLQHITKTEDHPGGLQQIVSGGGGATPVPYDEDHHQIIVDFGYQLEYFAESLGFVGFEVDGSSTHVTFHDDMGNLIYEFTRTKGEQ